MHCPRCGQQQISAETKFCSRCGFPLGLISEVLAHGGFLPQLAQLHTDKRKFTRKNGVTLSILWCLFFLLILAPFFSIIDIEKLSEISAVVGIFGGMMIMVASLLMVKQEPPKVFTTPHELPTYQPNNLPAAKPSELSPALENYISPSEMWRAPNTDDLARRGSVTDNTTKLLNKTDNG